ncbi:MAG: VanZ family protein [Magnetococcales bacterium]|nr:VanZ family protein [Magnetococcales bacterium]
MQLEALVSFLTDPARKKKGIFILALLTYSGLIYLLSSMEGQPGVQLFENQDKVEHVIAFGAMACVAWWVLRLHPLFRRAWLWAWCYAAAYGAFDEWHQLFVPGRYADLADWMADAIGAALAICLLEYLRARGKFPPVSKTILHAS